MDQWKTGFQNYPPGMYVGPGQRAKAVISEKTHARIRHDYATWHPEHLEQIENKTSPKLPYANKSKFDSARFIAEAVEKSNRFVAIVGANGHFAVSFDMGHSVGFDAVAKRQTSLVTVVVRQDGNVVTAYPGASWTRPYEDG